MVSTIFSCCSMPSRRAARRTSSSRTRRAARFINALEFRLSHKTAYAFTAAVNSPLGPRRCLRAAAAANTSFRCSASSEAIASSSQSRSAASSWKRSVRSRPLVSAAGSAPGVAPLASGHTRASKRERKRSTSAFKLVTSASRCRRSSSCCWRRASIVAWNAFAYARRPSIPALNAASPPGPRVVMVAHTCAEKPFLASGPLAAL
mmetsp:Transcript_60679/g.156348  ORF Transcript_60679/g.156348 Transcript_60679/m.156348 type:complete len:205 (+) Transcript_60679:225-839(+)